MHFNTAIQQHPQSIAAFFGMAGAAKWCLSDPKGAVEQWGKGLAAEYKDASRLGVQMPILLYAASILRPGVYDGRRARDILAKQSKDSRIKDWPGPIAVWLLRDINDETLARLCVAPEQARTKDRQWLAQFYEGVCWRSVGESKKFLQRMRELTDIQKEDWADQTFFLARMWSEEFFVARHEAQCSDT